MFMTDIHTPAELDTATVSAIENCALHLAARNKGKLYTAQLLPYFSLSLETLDRSISNMVDRSSIVKDTENGLVCYDFRNLSDKLLPGTDLTTRHVPLESEDLVRNKIQHQVFYAASEFEGKIFAESIAASTDFTLQEVKSILKELSLSKFISEKLDEEKGSIFYIFPKVEYFEKNFKENMQYLRLADPQESFDAKAGDFVKYMFICLMMLGLLFFAKVNFRMLIMLFIASFPLCALMTYFKYKKI
jgi:hypothetical protein